MSKTPDHSDLGLRFFDIDKDGRIASRNGSAGPWVVGEWKEHRGPLEPCVQGLHYCLAIDAWRRRQGTAMGLVEIGGEQVHAGMSAAFEPEDSDAWKRSAEWNETVFKDGFGLEAKRFRCLETKQCDGCGKDVEEDGEMPTIRIGFTIFELCNDCRIRMKELM